MAKSFRDLVSVYQTNIDKLIDEVGKDITLFFSSSITNIDSNFNDGIRPGGITKPIYKETSDEPYPDIVIETKTIKALIRYDPKDFERFNIVVSQPNSIIRLKTYMTEVPDIMRCEYIIPNYSIKDIIYTKFKLLREPRPMGLYEDRYAVSYWGRI